MPRVVALALVMLVMLGMLGMATGCADPARTPPVVPAGAIPAGTVLGTAAITGKALFAGTPKAPESINMSSDATCHGRAESAPVREDLVVGQGGELKSVFVHVAGGLPATPFAPPAQAVTLDQRGCIYRPHVVGLQVGQQLLLVNSDPTLHNVHTVSTANKPFNFGMSIEGQKAPRYFHAPEVMVKAKCDVHPWMASYIGVGGHPFFAVTGDDGCFTIRGLPAGEYAIEAWHETAGVLKQSVPLSDGETKDISFTFGR